MVKILVVGLRGFPHVLGGIETHCCQLYPRLVPLGCEVIVAARSRYVPKKPYHYKGVKIIPLWAPASKHAENIVHTLLSHSLLFRLKPDIIHFHAIGPALLVPLTRLFQSRIVVTHHGFDYEREKWGKLARFCLRRGEAMLGRADAVISISTRITEILRKKKICNPITIPNGIPIPRPQPAGEICRKWKLEAHKYFLTTGRMVPEKNLPLLIDSFSRLKTNWKLVIAGDSTHKDPYSRRLKARASKVKNVVLTGFISGRELTEIYSNAGCFVLPSSHEGLSISLLEALSYRLPCLVANIPANHEIDQKSIHYFDLKNRRDLIRMMRRETNRDLSAISSPDINRSIVKEYSWKVIAQKTMGVYHRTIAGKFGEKNLGR